MALLSLLLLGCLTKTETGGDIAYLTPSPALTGAPSPAPTATAIPTFTPAPTFAPTATPLSQEAKLRLYIDSMSNWEKIGQLVMFGFSGTKTVSSAFASIMEEYAVGNVILYGPNISRTNSDGGFVQCASLTESIRSHNASEIPLLISTDVEGGNVTRFKWPRWPTHASTLGSNDDPEAATAQFAMIGQGLLSVGINTDLAPVMDVARDPLNTFLKKRIISSSAEVASRIGSACIEGLRQSGCLSFVKHFPGHGATTADSHETTPVVKKTLEELYSYELIPFAAAVDAGADGVMVAHISYPNIDAEHIASQSYIFITEVLREEMGFTGVVLSDDFRMAGLRNKVSLSEGAVQFILAGGDMILCGANHDYQRSILKGLTEAVESGRISAERLNESVFRILTAKMKATGWAP